MSDGNLSLKIALRGLRNEALESAAKEAENYQISGHNEFDAGCAHASVQIAERIRALKS